MNKRAFYQVWLPLIVSIILVGSIFFLLIRSTNGNPTSLSQWSDISMIYMLSPIIGITLVLLIFSIAAIYLFHRLRPKTKQGLASVHKKTQEIKEKTIHSCSKIVQISHGPSAWLKQYQGVQKDE